MSERQAGFIKVPNELWNDERLTGTEKLVMISLLHHLNFELRRSWPSQEVIAKECGISRFWARKILDGLEQRGYISVIQETGRGNMKIYAINTLPKSEETTQESESNGNSVSNTGNSVANTREKVMATQLPLMATQFPSNGNSVSSNGNSVATNKIKNKTKEQDKEQENRARDSAMTVPKEQEPRRSAAKAFDFGSEFEEFWAAYPKPKHPDKTPCRKRYEALRAKGASAEDLLNAARNYAEAMRRDRTPPQYIKRGATFLGPQEAWRDYVSVTTQFNGKSESAVLTDEEEFMRDAVGSGMISEREYNEWRRRYYGDERLQTVQRTLEQRM